MHWRPPWIRKCHLVMDSEVEFEYSNGSGTPQCHALVVSWSIYSFTVNDKNRMQLYLLWNLFEDEHELLYYLHWECIYRGTKTDEYHAFFGCTDKFVKISRQLFSWLCIVSSYIHLKKNVYLKARSLF